MVPPVTAAYNGMESDDRTVQLDLTGNCSPSQWVPPNFCFSQFYQVCATGAHDGTGVLTFGNNHCQTWKISNVKNGVVVS